MLLLPGFHCVNLFSSLVWQKASISTLTFNAFLIILFYYCKQMCREVLLELSVGVLVYADAKPLTSVMTLRMVGCSRQLSPELSRQ